MTSSFYNVSKEHYSRTKNSKHELVGDTSYSDRNDYYKGPYMLLVAMKVYISLGKFLQALLLNCVDKPHLTVRYAKSSFKVHSFDFSLVMSEGFLF